MRKALPIAGFLVVVFLVISHHPSRAQDTKSDVTKRIADLEQRVATLERILDVHPESSSISVVEAQLKLAAAEERLRYTERVYKKGYVPKLQLEADKFAYAQALKELQVAESVRQDKKDALEFELLDAERHLSIATEMLKQSERLRARGYVSESEVNADKYTVQRARKRLESARVKLKAYEQSRKDAERSAPEPNAN